VTAKEGAKGRRFERVVQGIANAILDKTRKQSGGKSGSDGGKT